MFKIRDSSLLTSPHFNFILMLEDNERGAYKVEAEAGLRFGVLVGRSWVNWCTHGTGVSRSGLQKSSQMEKEGGGCPWSDSLSLWGGGHSALRHIYTRESGEEHGSRTVTTSHFLAAKGSDCAFPLFSLPSIHNGVALLSFL